MQNIYLKEIEAAYMRRRVQDAVAASSLVAQAASRGTSSRQPFVRNLVLACLRAREVFWRRQPVLQPLPGGKELQAAQG